MCLLQSQPTLVRPVPPSAEVQKVADSALAPSPLAADHNFYGGRNPLLITPAPFKQSPDPGLQSDHSTHLPRPQSPVKFCELFSRAFGRDSCHCPDTRL